LTGEALTKARNNLLIGFQAFGDAFAHVHGPRAVSRAEAISAEPKQVAWQQHDLARSAR
jgi:hypothetical protein